MPRYSKQDYELVAGVINDMFKLFAGDAQLSLSEREHHDTVMVLFMARFINVFQEDNKLFDLERFMRACRQ